MTSKKIAAAFRLTVPVMSGYIALGFAFGLLAVQKNYPVFIPVLMSLVLYTGAGQFLAVGLLSSGEPLSSVVLAEALVNIRHIVYGLSIISKYKGTGKWKPYLVFSLTDETYSLVSSVEIPENEDKGSFYGTISLLNHIYWISGTVLGSVLGLFLAKKTGFSLEGLDFSLTALFAVLLVDQIKKSKDFVPASIGFIATSFFILLWKFGILPDSNNILLFSLAAGTLSVLAVKKKTENTTENKTEIRNEKNPENKTENTTENKNGEEK